MANNRDAGVGVSPEAGTIITSARIPCEELGSGDSMGSGNTGAAFSRLDEIECIAVGGNFRLRRLRCLNT